jgi:hypothetical protein
VIPTQGPSIFKEGNVMTRFLIGLSVMAAVVIVSANTAQAFGRRGSRSQVTTYVVPTTYVMPTYATPVLVAPTNVATVVPTYVAPVAPAYVAPAYVAPTYVAPVATPVVTTTYYQTVERVGRRGR